MLDLNKQINIGYPAAWIIFTGIPAAIAPLGEGRKPTPLGEDLSRLAALMKKYRKTSAQCI
jgi:hypothetical protein